MPIKRTSNNRPGLNVTLWGHHIGTLYYNPATNRHYFFFTPEYFTLPWDIAPLDHPKGNPDIRNAIYGPGPEADTGRIYQGLPPFLADSLPDAWGNAIYDEWFRKNGILERHKTSLNKLAFIGHRGMGALEFVPSATNEFDDTLPLDLKELYSEAIRFEADLASRRLGNTDPKTLASLAAIGTSAGGAHKKAIISIAPDGTIYSGHTSTDALYRHCILKFNTPEYCLSEMEQAYYDMATAAGLKMKKSRLYLTEGTWHFLTERFDRSRGDKILTQTLAAMNPDATSYEDLMKTCRRLDLPENEITDIFRQCAFNFLMNNTDDHRKNFSFLMGRDGIWHTAPPYDINFIINKWDTGPETNHCLSLRGRTNGITERDLIDFAGENSIRNPSGIISDIKKAAALFPVLANKYGIDGYHKEMIQDTISDLQCSHTPAKESAVLRINGNTVTGIRFEKMEKGAIHIYATINGFPRKHVITPGKSEYKKIIGDGPGGLTDEEKKRIIKAFFFPSSTQKF